MKHIFSRGILRLALACFESGRFGLAGFFASVLASVRLGRPVKVWWDGQDWLYRWNDSGAVEARCDYSPKSNWIDIDLFCFAYTPKSGDTLVDVGVENGAEIPSFCKMAGPTGRVIAIEADPVCCRRLHKLKALLNLENLSIIEAAVGASSGEVAFTQTLGTVANRIVRPDQAAPGAIRVQMATLPELLAAAGVQHVDYIKINIEGAEIDLLKGLTGHPLRLEHACVSCHDFIGAATQSYNFVYAWFSAAGYDISNYAPLRNDAPWRNYYLYAKAAPQAAAPASPNPHLPQPSIQRASQPATICL